jgi:hypothetical protein
MKEAQVLCVDRSIMAEKFVIFLISSKRRKLFQFKRKENIKRAKFSFLSSRKRRKEILLIKVSRKSSFLCEFKDFVTMESKLEMPYKLLKVFILCFVGSLNQIFGTIDWWRRRIDEN